jgi:hypothetical protein
VAPLPLGQQGLVAVTQMRQEIVLATDGQV